jgi:hypothetical protein
MHLSSLPDRLVQEDLEAAPSVLQIFSMIQD